MRYFIVIFVIPPSLYIFSFARYSWKKKEKLAAVGAVILGTASIALPLVALLIR